MDFSRVHVGDKLWKTDDPELNRRLRRSFDGAKPRFQRPIEMEVHGAADRPLTLIARDEFGNVARVESSIPLAGAGRQPLTGAALREQLGRLGGTPFRLGTLENRLPANVLLPFSELNRLRRQAVAGLEQLRARPARWTLNAAGGPAAAPDASRRDAAPRSPDTDATLIVLVRSLPQLEAALECGVAPIYCEFEDPKKYREAVVAFRAAGAGRPGAGDRKPEIFVAPPRVFKTGEEWILKQVRSSEADGYLVRNYDHLKFFAGDRCVGDYSLNVANRISAGYFKGKFGLERLTASYDLNFSQLAALLGAAPPEWFEITIHQHMPMFHMDHCVFCAFLSDGKDYRDCGRPCDRHDVKLRDRVGAAHPLKADAGCRNTVFNALAQTGAEYVDRLLALGVRHFRVEFLNETSEETRRTITRYRHLLDGKISGAQLWRELKLFNQLGVTRGQMGK